MAGLTAHTRDDDGAKWLCNLDPLVGLMDFDPQVELKKKEVTGFIARRFNRRDRLIIILHYCEELTVPEIGETLGLSEARVCQLYLRILIRLRNHLEKVLTEFLQTTWFPGISFVSRYQLQFPHRGGRSPSPGGGPP